MRFLIFLFITSCGVTDASQYNDTDYVQNLINTKSFVQLKNPPYHVDTLILKNNQTIECIGQYVPCLRGTGTGPVLTIRGRHVTIRDIMIENRGYPAIEIVNSPNVTITNARLKTDAETLSIRYSWRITVRDSFITTDGAYWAVHAIDNVNGLTIQDSVISGRKLGGAINVGSSSSVSIRNNIIETSLNGIWVCSVVEPKSGRCDGVDVSNNYIENSATPIKLGAAHNIWHGTVTNNYIYNLSQDFTRGASIDLGRVQNFRVCNNGISARSGEIPIQTNQYTNAAICDNYIR